MQKIAIPIFGDRISSRLDCSEEIMLVLVEKGAVKEREIVRLLTTNPFEKINAIVQMGVDVLICGGLPERCSHRLLGTHVQVIPWVSGEVSEVLTRYLEGMLNNNDYVGQGSGGMPWDR